MSKKVIEQVEAYIRSIRPGSEQEMAKREMLFSDPELGEIGLSDDEVRDFRAVLASLVTAVPKRSAVSERTVERWFQSAILTALRPKHADSDLEEHLPAALEELSRKLKTSTVDYDVYYPVLGATSEGLPIRIGKLQFVVFDDEQRTRFEEVVKSDRLSETMKQGQLHVLDRMWKNEESRGVFALTTVSAIDAESARLLGIEEIRRTLDVINFFADFAIPYNHGHLYLPMEGNTKQIVSPLIRRSDAPSVGVLYSTAGALGELSVAKFHEHVGGRPEYARLEKMLLGKRNKLEDVILAAIQWAGRATFAPRREEAFLLYVISLESLLLADGDKQELTFRFRVRLAHVLGETYESRTSIFAAMGQLYKVRSSIVHSGSFEVTDADLSKMRELTKESILRFLLQEPFVKMQSPQELTLWFQQRILGAGPESLPESD